jgi:hypothetical protein
MATATCGSVCSGVQLCVQHVACCGQHAVSGGRRVAGGVGNDGDDNAQVGAACSDVQLFSS